MHASLTYLVASVVLARVVVYGCVDVGSDMLESPWRMMDRGYLSCKSRRGRRSTLWDEWDDNSRQAMTAVISWRPGTVVLGNM